MEARRLAAPFRVGATSWVVPADIVPNVERLAGRVDDIELLLFEVDDEVTSLSAEVVDRLAELAAAHDLTYTVHLPLDLRLGAAAGLEDPSIARAIRVIEAARPLRPFAHIVHAAGEEVLVGGVDVDTWRDRVVAGLEHLGTAAGGVKSLAVENLERYPVDFLTPVLDRVGVSCCVDVGHLWLDGHDPVAALRCGLPRARVVHLHGVGGRDHQALGRVPEGELRRVLAPLLDEGFAGVLTVEVFDENDLEESLAALEAALSALGDQS